MYYLNSRYYNPEWGRFINADGIVGQTGALLTHNMFAYCVNNPVNLRDPSGCGPELALLFAGPEGWIILGAIVLCTIAIAYNPPKIQTSSIDIDEELELKIPIRNRQPQHEVYALTNNNDEANYVGRTGRTTEERYEEHTKTNIGVGLDPKPIARGLTYAQARGIEQIAYDHYKRAGNEMRNSINPISPLNPNKWYYMAEGAAYIVEHPGVMKNIIRWDKKN